MIRIVMLVLVVVGCSKDGPAYGWWQVPDVAAAGDIRDSALKLSPNEVTVVRATGDVVVRECAVELDGTRGQITGCGPAAQLSVEGNRLAIDKFVATRVSASRASELDALVAKQGRYEGDPCERARSCYRTAMELLRFESHEEEEFATMRGPTDCVRTTDSLVVALATNHKPIPTDCW